MTRDELKTAESLLDARTERFDTAICDGGQCLTAHWTDGGQHLFYSLDDVVGWLDSKRSLFSVVVYENDRLDILPGDYRRLTDDGIKRLRFVSLHSSMDSACAARDSAN